MESTPSIQARAQPSTDAGTPRTGRIHELDSLRGIAALGVVFWHYGAHFNSYPFRGLLLPFYTSGFLLVDFFFVLSGYVIARSYWTPRRQHALLDNIRARMARLYPLHLLTLVATVALIGLLPMTEGEELLGSNNDTRHFILNLFLINNIGLQDGWSFNTPAWSISTEFVINLAFMALIAMSRRTFMAAVGVAVALIVLIVANADAPYIVGSKALGFIDVNLARCALGFGCGVLVHILLGRTDIRRRLDAHGFVSTVLALLAIAGLTFFLMTAGAKPKIPVYLCSIALSTLLILTVPSSKLLGALLNRTPLVYLGDISYSVYLTHFPLQLVLFSISLNGGERFAFDSPVVFLAYVSSVLALSSLTYRFVEVRMGRYLNKIGNRHTVGP